MNYLKTLLLFTIVASSYLNCAQESDQSRLFNSITRYELTNVKRLIIRGVDINTIKRNYDGAQLTPLVVAVKALIATYKEPMQNREENRNTALKMIKWFFAHEADVNLGNPIALLIENKLDIRYIELFLKHGADPNQLDASVKLMTSDLLVNSLYFDRLIHLLIKYGLDTKKVEDIPHPLTKTSFRMATLKSKNAINSQYKTDLDNYKKAMDEKLATANLKTSDNIELPRELRSIINEYLTGYSQEQILPNINDIRTMVDNK